ncbi:MAG TPA: rhodanese-like domain-containing protein [Candidatus Limnocylindrales bacterium]
MFSRHNTPEIGIDELDDLVQNGSAYVLDVREDWEYKRGRVPGAISIPLGRLTTQVAALPKDKPYAVICESGSRSLSGTDYLLSQGFEGAVSVRGGTGAWVRSNRPIEKD